MRLGQGFIELSAAADFIGTGAIEVPEFESEILDVVRRTSVALNRFPAIPATGHPHRYFEQIDIARGAFTDPRNITPTPAAPSRVERPAFIKAITNQSNLSLFDKEVTEQQGRFASVVAKDIDDIISGIEVVRAAAIWVGNDTSLMMPTTTQYMGILKQITLQAAIAPGASIIDGLKAVVAAMVSNQTFVVKPTAIYLNPVLGDYIDREAKAAKIELKSVDVMAGVSVESITTQAGRLPLIGDPWVPSSSGAAFGFADPSPNKNYYAVIMQENMIELPYISGATQNPLPRLFQLGLIGNLAGQYVGIKFDTVIVKGPSYAHAVVAVARP
jgi:hypothetical protein